MGSWRALCGATKVHLHADRLQLVDRLLDTTHDTVRVVGCVKEPVHWLLPVCVQMYLFVPADEGGSHTERTAR